MERRCREIETGNNHLMEEMGKLSGEFSTAKEREENAKEERTKLQVLGQWRSVVELFTTFCFLFLILLELFPNVERFFP